ncbi:substrate-binding domain-containing protein [Hansschlegelia beijingensis]|uniref:substrate-binding domain-containing protein n=1 Tax=Hansschlegelia beijingensis TaxID=1133344 RepID=UPI00387EFDCC
MSVRLRLDGDLRAGGETVPLAATLSLLDKLDRTGSLQGAAKRLGVSYRSAWGQLARLETSLGRALVVKTKGHGSVLTPFGAELRQALAAAFERIEPMRAAEEAALNTSLAGLFGSAERRLRVCGSHDPLLLSVIERVADVEFSIAGSMDALAKLAAGGADAAGFHYGSEGEAPPPLDGLFRDPELTVRPLFRREQGLMFARGNPLGLQGIPDLVARQARFVNRQRGAGTRIWFERLCAECGIATEDIVGFHSEEFTHQAVAALIASNAADSGMGTRAAAEAFGLDFKPLGWEVYFLAARASVPAERLAPLIDAARYAARETPGYGEPHHSRP